jgi:hypothetical protein
VRILSPYPDHHFLCRPGSTRLEPGQIAGILDGDGSFTLLRRRSTAGIRIRPQIALVMRDDDPTPLSVWASIKARRGRPMGVLLRSRTQRRHEWRVDRLDEVVELADWLARHPLLSPRGYRQLAMVREVSLILLAARIPGGGMRRLPIADQARLLEIRALIPARGQPVGRQPSSPVADLVSMEHRGWVLAGLVAAEGSFSLRNEHSKFAPRFELSQRIDNVALLESLRDELGIGTLRVRPGRTARSGDVARWVVSRLGECRRLVDQLRQFPIPISSPKAGQFDCWAAALDIRDQVTAGGRRHGASGSTSLAAAAAELRAMKTYRGPRLLCDCPEP